MPDRDGLAGDRLDVLIEEMRRNTEATSRLASLIEEDAERRRRKRAPSRPRAAVEPTPEDHRHAAALLRKMGLD